MGFEVTGSMNAAFSTVIAACRLVKRSDRDRQRLEVCGCCVTGHAPSSQQLIEHEISLPSEELLGLRDRLKLHLSTPC
jgi:hypothetical protein